MEIGQVRVSDLDAIGQLHVHFWGEVSDVDAMAETLSRLDGDPDHMFLAARVDGECVGTATGVVCHGLYGGFDSYLVIEDLVVDPRHRRIGVGSALVEELEQFARARDCRQMIVLSETSRTDAHGLYKSAGFADRWTGFKKRL